MKFYCISNLRMPTEKAHGYQVAKMCEAFVLAGVEVELIVPTRRNNISEDVFDFYSLRRNFIVTYLSCFDFFRFEKVLGGRVCFFLNSVFFQLKIKNEKLKINHGDVAITRNPELVPALVKKGLKVFFDAHRWPGSKNELFKKMLLACSGIIANSKGTGEAFRAQGFDRMLVAPNGVDLSSYQLKIKNEKLRERLLLPVDKKIVMYVGHLYAWKGIDVLMSVAGLMRDREGLLFVVVGGLEADVAKYRKQALLDGLTNILFLGHRKKSEIPQYQMAADVLLLPNVPLSQESSDFTSPIKMFEYMASGVPIIASALSSIKEVLNDENACLVRAGDAGALSEAIDRVLSDNDYAKKIAGQARQDVEQYTWEKRAEKIVGFIKNLHDRY